MQRPRKTAEYYNEDMFVCRSSLTKYKCIHCDKLPKSFFRCKCGKEDEKQETGKGRARFDGNTGLSCSDCKHQACTNCGQSDHYEPDTITNSNIGKLMVVCKDKCGENVPLYKREDHLKNECSNRKRTCKYAWAGCKSKGTGDKIEQHEKKAGIHALAAIDKLKKDNEDLIKRIGMIEAKLS